MQVVVRPELEGNDRVIAIAAAEFVRRTAKARDQSVVDLRDGESGVVGQEEGIVDDGARHQSIARIGRNGARNGPVAAACLVAGGRGRRLGALRSRQIGVGPADRLKTLDVHLVADANDAHEGAEPVVPGVACDDRGALAPLGALVFRALCAEVEVCARIVERPRAAHVHGTRGAAFDHGCGRALVNRKLGEQLRREQVEVDFPVGVLRIRRAGGGDRNGSAVQQDAREVRAEAANRDVGSFTGDITGDRDAGNAIERLGDIGVGEFADVFRGDRVDKPDCLALGLGGLAQTLAVPRDDHFLQFRRVGPLADRHRLRILRLRDCSSHAQTQQTHRSLRVCLSIFHDIPLEFESGKDGLPGRFTRGGDRKRADS